MKEGSYIVVLFRRSLQVKKTLKKVVWREVQGKCLHDLLPQLWDSPNKIIACQLCCLLQQTPHSDLRGEAMLSLEQAVPANCWLGGSPASWESQTLNFHRLTELGGWESFAKWLCMLLCLHSICMYRNVCECTDAISHLLVSDYIILSVAMPPGHASVLKVRVSFCTKPIQVFMHTFVTISVQLLVIRACKILEKILKDFTFEIRKTFS